MFAEMMTYTYKSNLMMMKLNQGKVEKAQAPSQPQASTTVLSWRRNTWFLKASQVLGKIVPISMGNNFTVRQVMTSILHFWSRNCSLATIQFC